jgi:O-antigen ligase
VELPPGILGPLGAVALTLSATFGLFQAATPNDLFVNLYSLALPFVVLWSFWNLPYLQGSIARLAIPAAAVLAALSAVVVIADVTHPAALNGPYPNAARAAWVSGFGTQSTGWSHGVALYVPFLAATALSGSRRRAVLAVVGIALIISGQFVVFGRGGIAISLLGLLVMVAYRLREIVPGLLVASALLVVPVALVAADEPEPFAEDESITFADLDRFSSNRLVLLQEGTRMIADRPLSGYGFGNDWVITPVMEVQIHVTWMRMAVQGGVLFPVVLLAIVITLVGRALSGLRPAYGTAAELARLATVLVIVGGLVASFIEPNAIIGAFHASALWWAAAGVTARWMYDTQGRQRLQKSRHWKPQPRKTGHRM